MEQGMKADSIGGIGVNRALGRFGRTNDLKPMSLLQLPTSLLQYARSVDNLYPDCLTVIL